MVLDGERDVFSVGFRGDGDFHKRIPREGERESRVPFDEHAQREGVVHCRTFAEPAHVPGLLEILNRGEERAIHEFRIAAGTSVGCMGNIQGERREIEAARQMVRRVLNRRHAEAVGLRRGRCGAELPETIWNS